MYDNPQKWKLGVIQMGGLVLQLIGLWRGNIRLRFIFLKVSWAEIRRQCCGNFWKWGTYRYLVPIRVYLQWQVKFCGQGFLGSNKSKFRMVAFSFWQRIGFYRCGPCKRWFGGGCAAVHFEIQEGKVESRYWVILGV